MITGQQVKAALAFLGWSRKELSEASDVPARTIQRIAEADGVPTATGVNIEKVQRCLESQGITFLDDGDAARGSGVSLRND